MRISTTAIIRKAVENCSNAADVAYQDCVSGLLEKFASTEQVIADAMSARLFDAPEGLKAFWLRQATSEVIGAYALEAGLLPRAPVPIRKEIQRHIADEMRHSRYFLALADEVSSTRPALDYERLREHARGQVEGAGSIVHFLISTAVAELRGVAVLEALATGLASRPGAGTGLAVVTRILKDEVRHATYALVGTCNLAPDFTPAISREFSRYSGYHIAQLEHEWSGA